MAELYSRALWDLLGYSAKVPSETELALGSANGIVMLARWPSVAFCDAAKPVVNIVDGIGTTRYDDDISGSPA